MYGLDPTARTGKRLDELEKGWRSVRRLLALVVGVCVPLGVVDEVAVDQGVVALHEALEK